MSRYSAKTADGRHLVWGWDPPLGEYFMWATRTPAEIEALGDDVDEDDDSHEFLFHIGSYTTFVPHPDYPGQMVYSKSELIPIMEKFKDYIPKDHIDAIALDVPF